MCGMGDAPLSHSSLRSSLRTHGSQRSLWSLLSYTVEQVFSWHPSCSILLTHSSETKNRQQKADNFSFCAGWETLRYLTLWKPAVFQQASPCLPPRGNKCFPDPLPVRFPCRSALQQNPCFAEVLCATCAGWENRTPKKSAQALFFLPCFQSLVRVERIELSSTAWKAVILPLNYTRTKFWKNKNWYFTTKLIPHIKEV